MVQTEPSQLFGEPFEPDSSENRLCFARWAGQPFRVGQPQSCTRFKIETGGVASWACPSPKRTRPCASVLRPTHEHEPAPGQAAAARVSMAPPNRVRKL